MRVTTGNVDNADTSANVFFTLCGDLCGTGGRPLFSSSASDTKWQKGQTDVFIVEAVDVGKFQSVTLQHDGQERGNSILYSVVRMPSSIVLNVRLKHAVECPFTTAQAITVF